ncbi:hypothetical protein Tco_0850986 [Tanacetum coccineum]
MYNLALLFVKRLNIQHTESKIKFIGKEVPMIIVDSQPISVISEHQELHAKSNKVMKDADSDLESMPGDEIESLSGFEAESNNDDTQSVHKEELSKADEATTNNVEQLESSLAQRVVDKIKESVPRMVADALEERIPELLSDTIKTVLPDLLKDSIKKALPKFDKQVKQTLKAQVPDLILKPLNKELIALNTLENNRLVDLQKKLTKAIHTKLVKYVKLVRKEVKVFCELLKYFASEGEEKSTQDNKNIDLEITVLAPAQGEQQPINNTPQPATTEEVKVDDQGEQSSKQAPPTSTTLVVQSLEEEPPVKKVKFTVPESVSNFTIPSLTPLNSIMLQGIRPPIIFNNIPYDQFTASLFSLSSSEFSPTPPPLVADKGKGKAIKEDPIKQLMPFIKQGGSAPKIPNL